MAVDSNSTGELEFDGTPVLRVHKDGRVERFMGTDVVPPASSDPATGVGSKDVVVDPDTGVWVRLFLPPLDDHDESGKLPVLVYFHGGGFIIESASSPTFHNYLNSLVSRARVVAVSVDYRLAPDHPLPAAYDDCWLVLQWVASHAADGGAPAEPWLAKHGEVGRLFLAGDSAGGNIAHHMAMRAGAEGLGHGVNIEGIVLSHPYFWIERPVESRERHEQIWRFLCPSSEKGLEEPWINPAAEGTPSLAGLGCGRVLVCLAEKDFLREPGWGYYEALRESGFRGEVEVFESEGEDHVFHLRHPTCDKAAEKMERLVEFLKGGGQAGAAVPNNQDKNGSERSP